MGRPEAQARDFRPGDKGVKTASQVDTEKIRVEVSHIINTFRDFPVRYAAADRAKKASILREMADAAVFGVDEVAISWKKPFDFFMREEITSINKVDVSESSKTSTSAGEMGLKLLDTSLINAMTWCRKTA